MIQHIALAAVLLFLLTGKALATVSEYGEFVVPYERAQGEEFCLSRQIMEAEFGIPFMNLLPGMFSPTTTLHQRSGMAPEWKNINLLAGEVAIPWQYLFDRYHDNGVYDYSLSLDFAALAAQNGNDLNGRQKTQDTAKLALISLIRTAELVHGPGKFRLWLRLEHLPEQSGLTGSVLYAGQSDWPGWPYTSSSPLYQRYRREMISPYCP
jgi:hypothetical protein